MGIISKPFKWHTHHYMHKGNKGQQLVSDEI